MRGGEEAQIRETQEADWAERGWLGEERSRQGEHQEVVFAVKRVEEVVRRLEGNPFSWRAMV